MSITGGQIENYITTQLECEVRHNCKALAMAINTIADELQYDSWPLMRLVIENYPIDELHTHSYGFHTANGREIINSIQSKYYEYESNN